MKSPSIADGESKLVTLGSTVTEVTGGGEETATRRVVVAPSAKRGLNQSSPSDVPLSSHYLHHLVNRKKGSFHHIACFSSSNWQEVGLQLL